ncbi:glycoside hydrolase family 17 protein [Clavulina sp. PMI_390]|nr:glycoside hydrolase family 17 protein [Clavulina sp. PMI_390]
MHFLPPLETAIGLGVALVIGGIAAGVAIAVHKKSNGTGSNDNSNNTSSGGGGSGGSSDPSNFQKNPNLHNSFYGFAYTPQGAILPDCGANISAVIEDIQLMSQLTTRIRTYGSDCNVSSLILDAITQTKVNVSVFLGIYISSDDTVYQRQRDLTVTAIQSFGADHVAGITVGNEVILDNLTAAGLSDPNSSVGIATADFLKTKISDVRSVIGNLSLSKTIPIGYADAGAYFNTDIIEATDYCMANVHPWFAGTSIDDAASWTATYFQETDVALAATTTNNPPFYIAETGWPTNSSTAADMQDSGGAAASVANLQIFMDDFVCQANQNGTGYFFFEFMDEPWKTVQYGGVEGYWGVFDSDKNLKSGLTIPDCSHQ